MDSAQHYSPGKDSLYFTGLALIAVAFLIFCIPFEGGGLFSGTALANFGLAACYFFVLLISGRLRKGREGLPLVFNLLILFLISCYNLNREVTVFNESVDWFAVLLVIVSVNYALFPFFDKAPKILQSIMLCIAGIAFAVFLYLSIYLLPTYGVAVVGLIVFGISIHAFIPLLLCVYTVVLLNKCNRIYNRSRIYFFSAFGATLLTSIVYTVCWAVKVDTFKQVLQKNKELPSWVLLAQKSSDDFFSERVLKSGIAYAAVDADVSGTFWRMPTRGNFGTLKHDPLALIASVFSGKLHLDAEDHIKVLKTVFDAHHKGEARFWEGDALVTRDVKTDIIVWPDLRIAYTEMVLEVFNKNSMRTWPQQQEAIYSFYVPEGAVVTSLSLWINNREEKGILTTKSKAAKAYNTIVGVQQRDPSVVHWQEGNRVSVRVFPVVNNDFRKFKIGISSPLSLSGNRLHYRPIHFEGPAADAANTVTHIRFSKTPAALTIPAGFNKKEDSYESDSMLDNSVAISFDAEALSNNNFSFNNQSYRLTPYIADTDATATGSVYLDVNAAWEQTEVDAVYTMFRHKQVYALNAKNEMQLLTDANKQGIFDTLREDQFSLFPYQKIPKDNNALVIVKSMVKGPALEDLKNTIFHGNITRYFAGGNKVKVFNLGDNHSMYLAVLKQCRAVQYAAGDLDALHKIVSTQSFPVEAEKPGEITIGAAGVTIRREDAAMPSSAPDHLMRLYAYNNILRDSGVRLLTGEDADAATIAEAEAANIVTPVSSLVVLETQKDYENFDIKESKDGLKNAAMQSKGAVPEPHEWALIILAALLLLYVRYQSTVDLKISSWRRS